MVKLGSCARNSGWRLSTWNILKSFKLNRKKVGRSSKNLTKNKFKQNKTN